MKIILLSLQLLLVSVVLAEELWVDSKAAQQNTTDVSSIHAFNDSSSVTLTPSMLKQPGDGRIMLNIGGGEDGGDDGSGKKPRPFFMGKNIVWLLEVQDWWQQEMESLSRLLDQPMTPVEQKSNEKRLNLLERIVQTILRQEIVDALAAMLGLTESPNGVFEHHPGYQTNHPAHSQSGQGYTVPGIVAFGGGESGGAKRPSGRSKQKERSSSGSGNKKRKKAPAGFDDGAGGGNREPGDNSGGEGTVKTSHKGIDQKHVITKELDDLTKLRTEVDDSLYCSICTDLLDGDATQCFVCEHLICTKDTAHPLWNKLCPSCKGELNDIGVTHGNVRKYREIRNLIWKCSFFCGEEGTMEGMKGHYSKCSVRAVNEEIVNEEIEPDVLVPLQVVCKNPGCNEEIFENAITEHLNRCDYQLVECGHKLCHEQRAKYKIKEHEAECDWAEVQCKHSGCGDYLLRKDIEEHYDKCDFALVSCSYLGCGKEVIKKDFDDHQLACDCRLIGCKHEGCEAFISKRNMSAHEAVCAMRVSDIDGVPVLQWKKEFIEKHRGVVPEGFGVHSMACAEPAAVALTLLLEAVHSHESSQAVSQEQPIVINTPLTQRCHGCNRAFTTEHLPEHVRNCHDLYVNCPYCHTLVVQTKLGDHQKIECEELFVYCDWRCGRTVLLKDLDNHMESCEYRKEYCSLGCGQTLPIFAKSQHEISDCVRSIHECPIGCGEKLQLQNMVIHQSSECSNRIMSCPHKCGSQKPCHEMEQHSKECEYRAIVCSVCSRRLKASSYDQHVSVCQNTWDFDGRTLERQLNPDSEYPIYEADEGRLLYLLIPTCLIRGVSMNLGWVRFCKEKSIKIVLEVFMKEIKACSNGAYRPKCYIDCLDSDSTVLFSYGSELNGYIVQLASSIDSVRVMGEYLSSINSLKGEWVYLRIKVIAR